MVEKTENKVGGWYLVKDVTERQLGVMFEVAVCLGCLPPNIGNQGSIQTLVDIMTLQLLINIDKVIYKVLSIPIKIGDKKHFKRTRSELNQFYKSVVVKALKTVLKRFDQVSVAFNVAHTSQTDSDLDLLLGKRDRNRFYQFWRGVFGVIRNAGWNVRLQGSGSHTFSTKHLRVFWTLTKRTVKYLVDVVLDRLQVLIKSTNLIKDSGKREESLLQSLDKLSTGCAFLQGFYPDPALTSSSSNWSAFCSDWSVASKRVTALSVCLINWEIQHASNNPGFVCIHHNPTNNCQNLSLKMSRKQFTLPE
ncbi:hypothetical protein WA1_18000 [Scytonema hofmannii PCC 7110]|uniref:Uncharacterized protein n=1 Tax=Scytonema hofmannii PCC 7110 TaxID=128403 RepID=A0A139XB45_9CYAN|nr:hypothetical protein [Scytonema hofmannii]KYC41911.1 hypothetical protein WA1_18000 [Scytonema hofmannii PCC 7110]